jgi:amicyanin
MTIVALLCPGRARAGALLVAALLALSGPASAADAEVKIDNFTFSPAKLVIKAGTTVTWKNEDDIPHTVASATKAFKSKALDTDDSYSFTFATAGTFEYFCSLHPHMTGTVVVEPAASSAPSQ